MQRVHALPLADHLALGRLDLFAQAMVGGGEDDPDVKALTIALVNGRIVDATIRCLFYLCRQPFRVLLTCSAQNAAVDRYTRAGFPSAVFFHVFQLIWIVCDGGWNAPHTSSWSPSGSSRGRTHNTALASYFSRVGYSPPKGVWSARGGLLLSFRR